jgi:hypothetical protein
MDLDGNGMADNEAERKSVLNGLPSYYFEEEDAYLGPSGIAVVGDETYFVTGGFFDFNNEDWAAVWSTAAPNNSTNPLRVANPYAWLAPYEAANNPDGTDINPNPYGLVVDAEGYAYVNDAGANVTYRVAPDGSLGIFALWPPFPNTLPFGPPVVHAVPTGITWGPDGALYIGFLTGGPFGEGASAVYRLSDVNGDGDAMDDGEMEVYADGLTTVTAIAFDDEGNLLATEFRGFLTSENPEDFASGRVVEWHDGEWHVLADGLFSPTGLAVGWDGTIYVALEYPGVIMQIHEAPVEE